MRRLTIYETCMLIFTFMLVVAGFYTGNQYGKLTKKEEEIRTLIFENKDITVENKNLKDERDKYISEKESAEIDRDKVLVEKEKLKQEKNLLAAEIEQSKNYIKKLNDEKVKIETDKNKLAVANRNLETENKTYKQKDFYSNLRNITLENYYHHRDASVKNTFPKIHSLQGIKNMFGYILTPASQIKETVNNRRNKLSTADKKAILKQVARKSKILSSKGYSYYFNRSTEAKLEKIINEKENKYRRAKTKKERQGIIDDFSREILPHYEIVYKDYSESVERFYNEFIDK